jgi:hypothetical protein
MLTSLGSSSSSSKGAWVEEDWEAAGDGGDGWAPRKRWRRREVRRW